jgi:hypothetical protein
MAMEIIFGSIIFFFVLLGYALCATAGKADRDIDEIIKKHLKEENDAIHTKHPFCG